VRVSGSGERPQACLFPGAHQRPRGRSRPAVAARPPRVRRPSRHAELAVPASPAAARRPLGVLGPPAAAPAPALLRNKSN